MTRPNTPRGEHEFQRIPCRALIQGEREPFDAELVHFERPGEDIYATLDDWHVTRTPPQPRWRLEARNVPWLAFANSFNSASVALLHAFFGVHRRPGIVYTGLVALSDVTVIHHGSSEASGYRFELQGYDSFSPLHIG